MNPDREKKLSLRRKLLFSIVIFIVSFFILEGGVRLFFLVKNITSQRYRNFDKRLGWVCAENVYSKRTFNGYGEITYSTTKYGFRVFGDMETGRTKIFVVGDSQTQAKKVADGETYYHYIKKNTKAEVFAYGCAGYGNLQEYMILDRYFDMIQPGIVIWQFSANDIVNNSWELESGSWKNNCRMIRPYYRDGKTEWLYPHPSRFYRNILRHSYLIKLLSIKLHILLLDSPEELSSNMMFKNDLIFNKAVGTTSAIMNLVRNRVGNTHIVVFCAGGGEEAVYADKIFSGICEKSGMHYIKGIPDRIRNSRKSGMVVSGIPYDSHWNNAAHSMVGKIIVDYMADKRLLVYNQ